LFDDDDETPGETRPAKLPPPGVGPLDFSVPSPWRGVLRPGTCSWKYPSWAGLVYDTDRCYHPHDYLVDYSRHFDTVEVDQWFWSLFPGGIRMPDPDTVVTYAQSVPENFTFSVKAPNAVTLTNYYARQPPRFQDWRGKTNDRFLDVTLVEEFLESLGPLGSRLGPVMFQFGYLNRKKMASHEWFYEKLDAFLGALPDGYPYAVEIRNANLLRPQWFDLLRSHNTATVLLDGYHMPAVSRVMERHAVFTSDFVVLRLHGPDRAGIERETGKIWNRVVAPKDRGLATAADLVALAAENNVRAYVNVNNHYEGSAPRTIARLLETLRARPGPGTVSGKYDD